MKNFIQITSLVFILIFCSCSNDDDKAILETREEPDISIAGYITNNNPNLRNAVYWKNGNRIDLTDGSFNSQARDIYVNGDDVYVAGYVYEGSTPKAAYWKNGVLTKLQTNVLPGGFATGISIFNNDLYVVGYESLGSSRIATYWKNENPINLVDVNQESFARSIFVNHNNIYIAGYDGKEANYWENGIISNLNNGTNSTDALDIFKSNEDIYIAGNERQNFLSLATYWKNGVKNNIDNNLIHASANSIYVKENDIYIVGYEKESSLTNFISTIWKNGEKTLLSDGTSYSIAFSVTGYDNDIYTVGTNEDQAVMWKNNIELKLNDDNMSPSNARSIFINSKK